jgi:PDZ domain-containing protein
LVFALQTVDLLTEGDLTRNLQIAATGTIDEQGSISAIGGVKQKTVSVSEGGADLFLVPKGNEEQAKKTAKRLKSDTVVIGVGTLEDAVRAIDAFATAERQG